MTESGSRKIGKNRPLSGEEQAATAEARIAQLDELPESPTNSTRWQFGLGPALVLLSLVAIYLGMTRSFYSAYAFLPLWVEFTSAAVVLIWLLVILVRTGMRLGIWREGRKRTRARRKALEELVQAKRALRKHDTGEATTTDPPTSP